jgi:hypothetical protein
MDLKTFAKKHAGRSIILVEDMIGDHQQEAIESLLYDDGVPYGMMSIEALGRLVPMDRLTYKQAVLLLTAGIAMRQRQRESQRKRQGAELTEVSRTR